MNENIIEPVVEDTQDNQDPALDNLRAGILNNTPAGQDPIVYWHNVAMDAIRRNQELQETAKRAVDERDEIKRDLDRFTKRLINQTSNNKSRIPLDISNLVSIAQSGNIDLTLSIGIRSGKSGINHVVPEVSDNET